MSWLGDLLGRIFGKPPSPPVPTRPPAPAVPPSPPDPYTLNHQWLLALNAERFKVGLAGMVTDPLLTDSAQAWATQIAQNGQLDHGNFQGRIQAVHPNTSASEDIAEGQADVAGVVAAWMASPAHRAAILGNYNRTGIGRADSPKGITFWVVDFVML